MYFREGSVVTELAPLTAGKETCPHRDCASPCCARVNRPLMECKGVQLSLGTHGCCWHTFGVTAQARWPMWQNTIAQPGQALLLIPPLSPPSTVSLTSCCCPENKCNSLGMEGRGKGQGKRVCLVSQQMTKDIKKFEIYFSKSKRKILG